MAVTEQDLDSTRERSPAGDPQREARSRRTPGSSQRPEPSAPLSPAPPHTGRRASSPAPPTAMAAGEPRSLDTPLAVAWMVFVATLIYLEPAPADPAQAIPLWGELLGLAFFTALGTALAGLFGHRSWGRTASLVAGGLGLAVAAACVATDHHTASPFLAYELAGFGALMAVTLRGGRASPPHRS